jgi:hypothetical protein
VFADHPQPALRGSAIWFGAGDEAALRPQPDRLRGQPEPHRKLVGRKAGLLEGLADGVGDAVESGAKQERDSGRVSSKNAALTSANGP